MFETKGVQESVKTLLQISGANKGINKLEQDFRIWIGLTISALLAVVLSFFIATHETNNICHYENDLMVIIMITHGHY